MRRVRPGALLLLTIAIAAILGHVCAPVVGDAHAAGHHGHGHDDEAADTLHAASCEAVRTVTVQPPMFVPYAIALAAPAVPVHSRTADAGRDAALVANSPPLYVVYASLLI